MEDYKATLSRYTNFDADSPTKSYFGILATLVLLIVLLLMIFPAIKHITAINKEIADARIVKTKLENKLVAIDLAKQNLESASSDLPLLNLALPVGSDLPNYLKRIEKLAKSNKLTVSTVGFTDVPLSVPSIQDDNLKTKKIVYTIGFEGSFTNFNKFLGKLEQLIRISDVDIVKIEKKEDEPLKESLEVTSYFFGKSVLGTGNLGEDQTQTPQETGVPGSEVTNE